MSDTDLPCSTNEDLSATAVVRRHLANVDQGIGPHLADAYAADARVEQPFLPEDRRFLHGREELRQHFAAAADLPVTMRVRNLVLHQSTGDPEVVIAEYDYEVTRPPDEAATTLANVQVFRVRRGEIVGSRDYHDHDRIRALLAAPADTRPGDASSSDRPEKHLDHLTRQEQL